MPVTKYHFSKASEAHLSTCDPQLVYLCRSVLKHRDCAVIEGFRGEIKQNEYYRQGLSHKKFPDSDHNVIPSQAVHLVPYNASRVPAIDWNNLQEFRVFGGFVLGIAAEKEIGIRWGGDWDGDGNPRNQTLHDLAHFELIK